MPIHKPPVVIDSNTVSFDINSNTVFTLFGISPVNTYYQIVTAQLRVVNSTDEVRFWGNNKALEIQEGDGPTSVTWGPFTDARTVVLKFCHNVREEVNDVESVIRVAKMKEYTHDSLKTAISLIPASNGAKDSDVHVLVYASRTSFL